MEKMLLFFGNVPNELWKTYAPTHLRNELLNTTTSSKKSMCFLNFAPRTLFNANIVSCLNSISALILIVFFSCWIEYQLPLSLGSKSIGLYLNLLRSIGRSVVQKSSHETRLLHGYTSEPYRKKYWEIWFTGNSSRSTCGQEKKWLPLKTLRNSLFDSWFLFTRAILVRARALER